ncbi:MAG TPA: ABC transporter ATP-binding protein [Candidatus Eisenbacteria bacterium]|nr:ABC transporter ATP-binding protein [Candidatus Eisenbacteria bacterium]
MIIHVEGVRKTYRAPDGSPLDVLKIGRLEIPDGAQWVITGRSGSGKTTFLNVLGGIVAPDEGRVRIGDTDVTGLSEARRDRFRARHLGYVFQTFNLLDGFNALENVLVAMLFGGGVRRDRALQLLDRVGLADRAGYRPAELSVGQHQSVAISRALANDPQVILADEPTGNVDPATGETIIKLLKEVCAEKNRTLIIVSHQPQVVASFKDTMDLSKLQN